MTVDDEAMQAGAEHAPFALVPDDGRPGHRRQAGALARALGLRTVVTRTPLKLPWRAVAPRGAPLGWSVHRRAWSPLPGCPPRVIVACGRRAALAGLWLRAHWDGSPALVQILDCGLPPSRFDAVIVPQHDRLRGKRVIPVTGSLNPVDPEWLSAGQRAWTQLAALPEPRVTVLLGGPARGTDFYRAAAPATLAGWGREIAARGGSMVLVATPRTPDGWLDSVCASLLGLPTERLDWPAAEPRYAAALAYATHLLVTADSTNLLSEACATGRPVAALAVGPLRGRRAALVDSLRRAGALVEASDLLDHGPVTPLRETPRAAKKLQALLGLGNRADTV